MRRIWAILLILVLIGGCSSEEPDISDENATHDEEDMSGDDAQDDIGDVDENGADTDTDTETENGEEEPLTAHQYCESTAEMFCDFYLRCGRMNASSKEECLTIFAETCEAKYEPHYAAQDDAGRLALSEEGIAACEAHLQEVACEEQVSDIDGPCRQMWVGLQGPGDECGPGIESLVCAQGTTCRLTMSFCGECINARQVGQTCIPGEVRCVDTASCIDGICVERGLPGQECSEEKPCSIGSSCTDGICKLFYEYVAPGESCDQAHRCPFNAYCDDGICKSQAGLGEVCTSNEACRSGYCDEVCKEFKQAGDSCGSSPECVSQICTDGQCAPIGYCI